MGNIYENLVEEFDYYVIDLILFNILTYLFGVEGNTISLD